MKRYKTNIRRFKIQRDREKYLHISYKPRLDLSNSGSTEHLALIGTDQLIPELMDYLQEKIDHPENVTGIPTGINQLDQLTDGLQPGELILIAGVDDCHLDDAASAIVRHISINEELPVAIFSSKRKAVQTLLGMASAMAHIKKENLRAGLIPLDKKSDLNQALHKLQNASLYIDDSAKLEINKMRNNLHNLKHQRGFLGLVVVDGVGITKRAALTHEINSKMELHEGLQFLKNLALELCTPIIILASLNTNLHPHFDQENFDSSDLIIKLSQSKKTEQIQASILKNRNGPIKKLELPLT